MELTKKELRTLSRDFRVYSSRLLNTNYGNEGGDLNRFIEFIKSNPILQSYIDKCCINKYDIPKIINEKNYSSKYQLPLKKENEVAFIYQLLYYAFINNADIYTLSHDYGSGNVIQDHIDAFNEEVTSVLITHIRHYIEDLSYDDLSSESSREKKIFLSYSWANKDIATIIDKDFAELGIKLTRDERDLKYKNSLREFMNSIGDHDYVITLISDAYLKSENCMYEITEVMRTRTYNEKILMIVLNDKDSKFQIEDRGDIGAKIYSSIQRIEYINYWDKKEKQLVDAIQTIQEDISKIQPLNDLKRVKNIKSNIADFMVMISDMLNISLEDHKNNDYKQIVDIVKG